MDTALPELINIADVLPLRAHTQGAQIAIRCPGKKSSDGFARYDQTLSYQQLDSRSSDIARGLQAYGIGQGVRTVVMLGPSLEFFLVMFALFKLGAVPVLIDPGIARSALKQCLAEAQAQAFIGSPLAHTAKFLFGWAKQAHLKVSVGARAFFGGQTLSAIEQNGRQYTHALPSVQSHDVAAILFTSGSTGVPKGVLYRHRHFVAQVRLLQTAFAVVPGGISLPTFPPFALFDPALGLSSVIPDMDPRQPSRADPKKLLHAITRFQVTQLFGSPALMQVLAQHGEPLPSLRCVISAGAPVPASTVEKIRALCVPEAQFFTPYGATECLPVSIIDGLALQTTRSGTEQGFGTCVGVPCPENTVRLIQISDAAITHWHEDLCVSDGEIGEVVVAGPSVTDTYFNRDSATHLSKIREQLPDGTERVLHRMGDLAWQDTQGRLWFCGRKSQRVQSAQGLLSTDNVEPIFNCHPAVLRSALVGLGAAEQQKPVLCVELQAGIKISAAQLHVELLAIASQFPHLEYLDVFLIHPKFPVDIRHNAKIGREQLRAWAAQQLGISA